MAKESYSDTDIIRMKCGAAVAAHRAVKLSALDTVIQATAINDLCIGISMQAGATDEWIPVQYRGTAKLECATTVTLNTQVMVQAAAANGKICDSAGATAKSLGVALEAGSNGAGDIILVELSLPNVGRLSNS